MTRGASLMCPSCGRPASECWVEVDGRFPEPARAAYEAAGYTHAAKCAKGQARDLKATVGWCMDRIVRRPDWTGGKLPGLAVGSPVQ